MRGVLRVNNFAQTAAINRLRWPTSTLASYYFQSLVPSLIGLCQGGECFQ